MAARRKKRGSVGGVRPGSGRKPKPRDEKQGHAVTINLTASEYEALREAAAEEPIATVVRRLVLRVLDRRKK